MSVLQIICLQGIKYTSSSPIQQTRRNTNLLTEFIVKRLKLQDVSQTPMLTAFQG